MKGKRILLTLKAIVFGMSKIVAKYLDQDMSYAGINVRIYLRFDLTNFPIRTQDFLGSDIRRVIFTHLYGETDLSSTG